MPKYRARIRVTRRYEIEFDFPNILNATQNANLELDRLGEEAKKHCIDAQDELEKIERLSY